MNSGYPIRRSHGTGEFTLEQFARLGDGVVFEPGVLVFHPENIEIGAGTRGPPDDLRCIIKTN